MSAVQLRSLEAMKEVAAGYTEPTRLGRDRVTPAGKARVSNVVKGGRLIRRNAKGAATLQRLLDKRGWTATTLQQQTRAAEETVSNWLAGTTRPRRHHLMTMASAFGEEDRVELLDGYGAHKLATLFRSGPPPFDARGDHGDIWNMDHLRLRPDQRKPDSYD